MSFSILHAGVVASKSEVFTDLKSVKMFPSTAPGGAGFYEAQNLSTFNYDQTQARSAFVWFKANDLSKAYGLFGNAAPGSGGGFEAFYSAVLSAIRFNLTGSLSAVTIDTTDKVLEVNKWVLFGFTYDGTDSVGSVKLWANGAQLSISVGGPGYPVGNTENATHALRIGGQAQGRTFVAGFDGYDGDVGDSYFFDDELTAAEVEELYFRGRGAIPEELSTSLSNKLIHHYTMGDRSADTDNIIIDRVSGENLQGVGAEPLISQDPEIIDEYPFVLEYAIEFDQATPNYIEAASLSAGEFDGFTPKTFLFWTKIQTDSVVLLNKRGPISADGWGITYFTSFGGLAIQIIGPGGGGVDELNVRFGTVPSLSDWVHVAITSDGVGNGAGVEGYINGSLATKTINTNTLTGAAVQNLTNLRIGADNLSGPTSPSDARFSEIAIIDGELSLSDVQEHYNSGIGADVRQMSWYNSANLDVYLIPGQDENDDLGSTIRDYSPNEWVFNKISSPAIVQDPVSPIV